MDITEEKLILKQIESDKTSFERFYTEYGQDIYRYLYSITGSKESAEDLTSQTFLTALQKIDQFESRDISIKYWIIKIARNLSLDSFRKGKWLNESYDASEDFEISTASANDPKMDLAIDINRYLEAIPVNTREIIVLKIWEEYTFKQIGELIGEGENTVKTQFYRGLEMLKRKMQEDGYDKYPMFFPILWLSIAKEGGKVPLGDLSGFKVVDSISKLKMMNYNVAFGVAAALGLVAVVTIGVLISLYNVSEKDDSLDESKPIAEAEENDSDESSVEEENEEETEIEEVEQLPERYTYSFSINEYWAPVGGPLAYIDTITFTSTMQNLQVMEMGSPEAGNLTNGLVGLTIVGNEEIQIRFDQYYEGFNMEFGSLGFLYLGTNPVIKGNIGRITEGQWHRYISNVSLEDGCFGGIPNEYNPPCGLAIVSFNPEGFIGISCKNDVSGEICKDIVLNISKFERREINN